MKLESGEVSHCGVEAGIRRLRKQCLRVIKRLEGTREKQVAEFANASEWRKLLEIGDSLLAAPEQIEKGSAQQEIRNVHTGGIEVVKLNPRFGAVRNAEIYFRKARKGKRGVAVCEEQLRTTREKLAQVENLARECDRIAELAPEGEEVPGQAVARLQEMAAGLGVIVPGAEGKGSATARAKVPYRRFVVDGWEVLVGKNNRQNDELTARFARPSDVWMHVAAHAGSHVVVRRPRGSDWPARPVLEKIAALCAWFSKARHASYIDVNVTETRFVRKPRKSSPGEVVAERCKTISVSPVSPGEMFREKGSR